MKNRHYYYTVQMSTITAGSPYRHFKAFSKKQIKKYFNDNDISYIEIYDPNDKPIHGIYYHDITDVFYAK